MFMLLGVHCGPDITVPAAASLAGVSRAGAGRVLAELAETSLAAEHRLGRYVMHDLVRGYAADQARRAVGEIGIRAATGRSLDHYLHTMVIPNSAAPTAFTVAPPALGVVPEMLADETALLAWVQAEHQVLLQATAQAAAAGFVTHAWQLFARQSWFLGDQGYWADFRTAGRAVLAAAQAAGDQAALGWTHAIIGRYGLFTGAADDGRAHQQLALDHFRRAGDLAGQGWAHMFTGLACTWKGGWAEAATLAGQALGLFRQAGDRYGEGWALAGLGEATLAWGIATWRAATPGRPWRRVRRPAAPQLWLWPLRGTRWVSCTPGSMSHARRSAVTGNDQAWLWRQRLIALSSRGTSSRRVTQTCW
jgi:hypothetical protein